MIYTRTTTSLDPVMRNMGAVIGGQVITERAARILIYRLADELYGPGNPGGRRDRAIGQALAAFQLARDARLDAVERANR